ncbi:endolytic transglycosylase MltG [Mycolicibacterium diernhoferi]|uniref:Endolytic murein transglycosylase n=1 Tax=Mycolicibacterium diernhoferi TaxID=1801 RepID=A0A1Q4HIT6_9MYCO|nr:endolytic transglycosylase MltG [Mycolicibacterium diernhoferi]OJZ67456.1 aminodeoxychorismate lyase [Mycolicibacterium diernhoferi]OPE53905.1 aminodeoxychorismate lyase [Mycolicibacterium diernhoferi]PEG54985.1 aminodeoxychorismate lyase [Mycolicibacterium diernhoferi]QYL25101.1 endolytic transglycosylase MltG [Mycolicibacterium diernhoferi]
MSDHWNPERSEPLAVGPPRRRLSRTARAQERRNARRRRVLSIVALAALVVVVIGAVFVGSKLWHGLFGGTSDFAGDGVADVVIEVHNGDSTTAIGQTLAEQNVVSSSKAFVEAAASNPAIAAIQPGFYKLRTEIPASSAVEKLADPQSRVGQMVIPEGRQLDDVADVKTNAVTKGILSLISDASCVDLDGDRACVSADELREAAGNANLTALSVPAWASAPVTAMGNDHRRLEGLIAPGSWNVDPSGSAEQILSSLIGASTALYEANGLLGAAATAELTPYEILIVASLVQRESMPQDFSKVARVIFNRLDVGQKLEFDSTVNFSLDRTEVATTDADRARVTPWNTYASPGLPKTPICSSGKPALTAAENPEPGDWLYFVTIDLQGTTLFTRDYDQHLASIELARKNGVLDSAR